jgi:hypothetical protein
MNPACRASFGSILSKLGYRSRVQIAIDAAACRLPSVAPHDINPDLGEPPARGAYLDRTAQWLGLDNGEAIAVKRGLANRSAANVLFREGRCLLLVG